MNPEEQHIFRVYGKIFSHPYDWGGNKLIPDTLNFTPEPGVPYAEYWIGTHEKAPANALLDSNHTLTLNEIINTNPKKILGDFVNQTYGDLPFLFKLLEAKEMLSLQVHPNKQQAEVGFEKEEKTGIALNDPQRTYKDTNHKPEYAVALDDFWLLHGFKQKESILQSLKNVPEFESLIPYFENSDYKKLYTYIMKDLDENEAQTILKQLAQRIIPLFKNNKLEKSHPDYWAAKAILYMNMETNSYDRGLFSIYLLNLVHLKKGEGIFQDAGLLHSYLEGPIIEVMATSDNVARGGITPKFVDVDELLNLVVFSGITPNIILSEKKNNELIYHAPIQEFQISQIKAEENQQYESTSFSGEILIVLDGNCSANWNNHEWYLNKGESIFITANTNYTISATKDDTLFKVSVPENTH